MKNIHLLPTNKPSRLLKSEFKITLLDIPSNKWKKPNVNIYITSNEYIGLSYYLDGSLVRKGVVDDKDYWEARKDYKKIILTTDLDLIKNGVQAIDDEFLKWFINNPSYDFVKIGQGYFKNNYDLSYKIIIPEEEPKQTDEKEIR